jgi:methionine synthase II (cobalamin-independent)
MRNGMASRVRTTAVGSYPVLPWMVGNSSRLVLRDAIMAVLKTQELAGLDLVSDGELGRFDPSNPETNGMIVEAVGPERVHYVNPDCGFWMLQRSVVDRKLRALVEGRDLFEGRVRDA